MSIITATARKSPWQAIVATLEHAFQPIVNIQTGACIGYEALLRNHVAAGFGSIEDLFDAASREGMLYQVDMQLREKAILKFKTIPHASEIRLFYNLDNRILEYEEYDPNAMLALAGSHGLSPAALCFELSERHEVGSQLAKTRLVQIYKQQMFKIAIDDFGTGFSGLQMLYFSEPNYIKIDRFFISDIPKDSKKRLFVSNTVNIAHALGMLVVAEGVESKEEYYICKEIGCDLVQGYFIQRPTLAAGELLPAHPHIAELARRDRRRSPSDRGLLQEQIEYVSPLMLDTPLAQAVEYFREHTDLSFIPIINRLGEPVGIVHERKIKSLAYSYFGPALLRNRALEQRLPEFLESRPTADINTRAEKILEMFSIGENEEGVFITRNSKYVGFLRTKSLLRVLYEKRIGLARDQNPLTMLPGNRLIFEYLSEAVANPEDDYVLIYFDFDSFKPFNDHYGFRAGDRVILMFADLLRQKAEQGAKGFPAHIGGDDFFLAFKGMPFEDALMTTRELVACFGEEVKKFYENKDRETGFIVAASREGLRQKYGLMGVSAAVLILPKGRLRCPADEIGQIISRMKKVAKYSPSKICAASTHLPKGRAL